MTRNVYVSLLIMCLTVYCIRLLPLLVFRREITNRWLRSFLYYVPYVTLAVMTFPSIVHTTVSPLSGFLALLAGIIAAWRGMGLFAVAAICCSIVYLMDSIVL